MSAGTRASRGRPLQAERRPGRLSAIARRRWVRWLLSAVVGIAIVLAAGYFWLRDSSLVSVRKVRISGVSGPDARQIRAALTTAARNMTTLDVNIGQLRTAVEPYPDVKRIEVRTQFPHGMVIRVVEQVPVAVVVEAGRRVEVAADGTLLHDVSPSTSLPPIPLRVPPGGRQLTGYPLNEVQLLGAAPYQLLARISGVSDGSAHGLVAELRNGPSVYFGDPSQLGAKWAAATAVLASSGSAGAVYIDVTDPDRPAAGAGPDTSASGSSAPTTGTSGSGGSIAGAANGSTSASSGG
ncbi:MAG: cell division protein FtsQ/DivIB [Solirubrobacteraceae bacterium]